MIFLDKPEHSVKIFAMHEFSLLWAISSFLYFYGKDLAIKS
jgi:hypothetical protein